MRILAKLVFEFPRLIFRSKQDIVLENLALCQQLVVQQFRGTFTNAFGPVTTSETTLVEKETQQIQIIVADMSAEEKIVPQATVEVLKHRTGLGRLWEHLTDGHFQVGKPVWSFFRNCACLCQYAVRFLAACNYRR